nr:hypothetical protein VITISV_031553 [Vitis vinifera]
MSDNTGAYITRMSPGLDKWRQENLDHSRRESWSKTYRCFLSSLMTLGQLKPLDVAKSRSPSPAPGFKCDSTPHATKEYPTRCHEFEKGKSQIGSSSNYANLAAFVELKESQNDATKERETVTRRSTYRERDPRRNRSLPCRYFTPGNCHLGKDCRLSHHAKACVDLEGRSENEKLEFGQYLCNKDQLSEGPKWADKSTISGVGSSSEGKDATAWSVDQGLDHRWGSRNIIDKDPDNESKKMQVEAKKPQENCPLEKSNDAKAMVAFKFQLVEFVKVLLSPTWKQGQLSKEAYKNIVKKVADKVIATIEGPYIPRTQQKIDQYLSLSKPKIAKLVQAYVEKFQSETRS